MAETWQDIAGKVAHDHGLTLADLRGPSRKRAVSWVRQKAWATLYETGRYSTPQLAHWFGRSNHTTVLHGIRAYRARRNSTASERNGGFQPISAGRHIEPGHNSGKLNA